MKLKTTFLLIASALVLTSCGEKKPSVTAKANEPSPAVTSVLSAAPNGSAQSITAARATAKPGDEITISGLIMGNADPFVDGRAAFILGDPEVLTPCNKVPGDQCESPWDNCCDSPEDKKRGTAAIQIVDTSGRVIKEPLEGVSGLKPLAHVTVTGKVAEGSSVDLLLINATAIAVK